MRSEPGSRTARLAVQAIFFASGVALAAWAPLVPYARTRLALGEGPLGLVLLALGVGGLTAMPLTGIACQRFGARPVVLGTALLVPLGLPLLAWAPTPWLLAAALFAWGIAIGSLDVAMNAMSVEVEQASHRPVLSGIHALYSIGSLAGALVTSAALRAGAPPVAAALGVAVALLALALMAFRGLHPTAPAAPRPEAARFRPPWRVVLLGVLCFVAFVTEGAMLDWSAVYLQTARNVPEASAGFGYVAFALAMVGARLAGDRLVARFGAVTVVRVGALVAMAGFALAALAPATWSTALAFALIGCGVANVVPSLFGAAAQAPALSAATALAIVATLGNAGTLVGPAAIGAIAAHSSLATSFLVVAAALVLVVAAAPLARRPSAPPPVVRERRQHASADSSS